MGNRSAAALLFVCVVLATAGPAQADQVKVGDPKGDVSSYDPVTGEWSEGPGYGDLSRLDIRHTSKRVTVSMRFHALGKYADNDTDYTVTLNTDRDAAWDYQFIYGRSDNPMDGVYTASASPVKQCNIRTKIDLAKDVVKLSAPRRCLEAPKRVKGYAQVDVTIEKADGDSLYFDFTKNTPWVKRG